MQLVQLVTYTLSAAIGELQCQILGYHMRKMYVVYNCTCMHFDSGD